MLFKVEMTVRVPIGFDPERFEALKAAEKALSQDLQRQGVWRHIWRVAGLYANVSIFDVRDNAHLHEVLMSLPLYPFMDIAVTTLCRHPSSIHADER